MTRRLAIALSLPLIAWALVAPSGQAPATPPSFAGRIEALSERGGYFDTDNLISNESSYLHVVPALRELRASTGAYIGVGPDQNFSYIAHLRPTIALIVDIRRDNMLLHLLFKALFELAPTRLEYLALLTGRAPPPGGASDRATQTIDALVEDIDGRRPLDGAGRAALAVRVAEAVARFGVPLSGADEQTIARFHGRFIDAGLSLQFNSTGRAPQWNYPTYRDLLLETDLTGTPRSFMATEDDFRFVKSLQARGLVIPVVGDLTGPTAVRSVGRFLAERQETVSAFYVSNIEFYLFRQGSFGRFVANLGSLPRSTSSVMVRSAFNQVVTAPGYNSASMTQPIGELIAGYAAGRFRRYSEVLSASR
jgi:hypothetical protein